MKTYLFQFHRIDIAFLQKIYHTQNHACRLGDDRCHRRRPDTPVEFADKKQIQQDVHKGGKDQIIQRAPAVPQGIHNAAADIVHHYGKGAEEIKAEVFHGFRHNFRICLHPGQEKGRKDHADDG